jgi:L-iditol 2-dehydrogenase
VRRAVFSGPFSVEVQHAPEPVRGDGQVLVAVEYCGICTWEQRVFRGVRPEYPLLGGHEVSGRVLEARPGAHVRTGDLVAISLVPRCGCCSYCARGSDNLCAYTSAHPHDPESAHGPGGLSQVLSVNAGDVYPIPDGIGADVAALVEPVACVLRSLSRGDPRPGDLVAVFGLGFTGQLHVMCARAQKCRTIGILTDRERAWPAEVRIAPDSVVASTDSATILQHLREDVGESGVDVAICTRGESASVACALKIVRPGGKVIVFQSIRDSGGLTIDPSALRSREISLVGSLSHGREDFARAAALVGGREVDPSGLIGRRFPLHGVQEALEFAVRNPNLRTMVHLRDADR